MAWISLAEAQAGAGTTDLTNAAAKSISAWLATRGSKVETAADSKLNTVFSHDGITFKQQVDTTVVEYRGLSKDLAKFLGKYLNEDNTREWQFWGVSQAGEVYQVTAIYGPPSTSKNIDYAYYWPGESGRSDQYKRRSVTKSTIGYDFYPPTKGAKVEATANRSNEADGWIVTETKTEFPLPTVGGAESVLPYVAYSYSTTYRDYNRAFIPIIPNEAADGIVTSTNKQKTLVAYDGGTPFYQNITAVTREYNYLTATEAAAKVNSLAANGSRVIDVRVLVSWGTGGSTYKNVQVRGGGSNGTTAATDTTATSRPIGNGYYCVSANSVTYQVTTS